MYSKYNTISIFYCRFLREMSHMIKFTSSLDHEQGGSSKICPACCNILSLLAEVNSKQTKDWTNPILKWGSNSIAWLSDASILGNCGKGIYEKNLVVQAYIKIRVRSAVVMRYDSSNEFVGFTTIKWNLVVFLSTSCKSIWEALWLNS